MTSSDLVLADDDDAVGVAAKDVAGVDDLVTENHGVVDGADGFLDRALDADAAGEHRKAQFNEVRGVADAGVGDHGSESLGLHGVAQDVAEGPGLLKFAGGHEHHIAGLGVVDGDLQHEVVTRGTLDGQRRDRRRTWSGQSA